MMLRKSPDCSIKAAFLVAMAAMVSAPLSAWAAAADSKPRPNVLLIMTDDQGWGDIRSHGNPQIDTPVLDKLAAAGARFDRFYVSPVCAPTRASLLTGRYHLRTGTHGVTRGMENMRGEEVTVAEVFKANGYATGCFGKWHNGKHYPYHPNGQGFEEFFGFCAGHWNNYFDTTLEHNGKPTQTKGYITDVLTDAALRFIEKNKDRPFFCYVPYNAPHSPWQLPDKYYEKYIAAGLDKVTACAYGMVENIDDNIGRLLTKLDRLKLADNTIVLFLTDNGPNSNRYNGNMKGRKGSVDEGGVRVPLFVRWPARIKPATHVKHIAAHIDLLPTLSELCHLKPVKTLPLDGRSLAPLVLGQEVDWPQRRLYTFRGKGDRGAVRTPHYRAVKSGRGGWQLYDMRADPGQKVNLAKKRPEVAKELADSFAKMQREVTSTKLEPLPIPVGHAAAPLVEMPGHEAFLEPAKGRGISYYGPSGWANDWVTNWTDTSAYPWWDVNVVRGGKYQVSLLYVCSKENLGAKLRVEVGGDSVEGKITQPHDPPRKPSPDRVSRKETYEKEWAELELGAVELNPGRTRLVVRALSKPGKQVGDIKAVRLRRVEEK